jgi:hypothetical protein
MDRTKLGEDAYRAFQAHGYDAYLKSKWWRKLRKERLHGPCRGCSARKAEVLHHTHYTHLGCETEAQTVPLCNDCHHLLHDKLLAAFPKMTRGASAKWTEKIWPSVFQAAYPVQEAEHVKEGKKPVKPSRKRRKRKPTKGDLAAGWTGNRSIRTYGSRSTTRSGKPRKGYTQPKSALDGIGRQRTELDSVKREALLYVGKATSNAPPQEVRPTGRMCGALTQKVAVIKAACEPGYGCSPGMDNNQKNTFRVNGAEDAPQATDKRDVALDRQG